MRPGMCRTDQENWPIARRSYVSTDINLIYQASLTTVTSWPQCKASKRVESKPLKNTETITGFTNVAFIEGTIVFLLCFLSILCMWTPQYNPREIFNIIWTETQRDYWLMSEVPTFIFISIYCQGIKQIQELMKEEESDCLFSPYIYTNRSTNVRRLWTRRSWGFEELKLMETKTWLVYLRRKKENKVKDIEHKQLNKLSLTSRELWRYSGHLQGF